jgi:hypothetical protein
MSETEPRDAFRDSQRRRLFLEVGLQWTLSHDREVNARREPCECTEQDMKGLLRMEPAHRYDQARVRGKPELAPHVVARSHGRHLLSNPKEHDIHFLRSTRDRRAQMLRDLFGRCEDFVVEAHHQWLGPPVQDRSDAAGDIRENEVVHGDASENVHAPRGHAGVDARSQAVGVDDPVSSVAQDRAERANGPHVTRQSVGDDKRPDGFGHRDGKVRWSRDVHHEAVPPIQPFRHTGHVRSYPARRAAQDLEHPAPRAHPRDLLTSEIKRASSGALR